MFSRYYLIPEINSYVLELNGDASKDGGINILSGAAHQILDQNPNSIIIDQADENFRISSRGLGEIIGLISKFKNDSNISFSRIRGSLKKILTRMELYKEYSYYETLNEAIDARRKKLS